MELTGKCKEDFEEYLLNWIKENVAWECETPTQEDVDHFYKFPFTMQWGVVVEFFDSVGLEYSVLPRDYSNNYTMFFKIDGMTGQGKSYKTRQEAQIETIKKANELYNQNN